MNPQLCSTFKFIGVVNELPKWGNMGELVQLGNESYVWFGSWEKIVEPVKELVRETNCPNCGGVLNPHKPKCEFCGTYVYRPTYEDRDEIEVTTLEDMNTRKIW